VHCTGNMPVPASEIPQPVFGVTVNLTFGNIEQPALGDMPIPFLAFGTIEHPCTSQTPTSGYVSEIGMGFIAGGISHPAVPRLVSA
jgi:hypothetical protein